MLKSSARAAIRLRGVRHNNLKNFDLDLPLNQFMVITGLSGSGKSSLAFDTLFAEGQRRYIETFSPYARQFFDRMDKPQVDSIEGIPPAIAIEQRNAVRTTRSTVGTMTEICDYMKMLWPHVAQLHCRQCGRPVRKDSPAADLGGHPRAERRREAEARSRRPKCSLRSTCRSRRSSRSTNRSRWSPNRATSACCSTGNPAAGGDPLAHHASASRRASLTVVQDRLRLARRQPRAFRRSLRTGLSFRQRQAGRP